MAPQNIRIEIGDKVINVPHWASEETLEQLGKHLLKSNNIEQSSYEVLKKIAINTTADREKNKLIEFFKKLDKNIDELKKATHGSNDAAEDLVDSVKLQAEKERRARDKFFSEVVVSQRDLHNMITRQGRDLIKSSTDSIKGAFEGNFEKMGSSIGNILGQTMGSVLGTAGGVFDDFIKSLHEITNVGIGFGMSLSDLRNQAADAGLSMDNYSALMVKNGKNLLALGTNTQDASAIFSKISNDIRSASKDNFGLTNTELNQAILDEINIRRMSGMNQQQITTSLNNTFSDLMYETMALSRLTGEDRREMQRRRVEAIASDARYAAASAEITGRGGNAAINVAGIYTALSGVLGQDAGGKIATALTYTESTGMSLLLDENIKALTATGAAGAEFIKTMEELSKYINKNISTTDPTEFNAEIIAIIRRMGDLNPDVLRNLQIMSSSAVKDSQNAIMLQEIINRLTGLTTDPAIIKDELDETKSDIEKTGFLGLPGILESAYNKVKATAIDAFMGTMGVDQSGTGEDFKSYFKTLEENLDIGILHTVTEAFSEMPWYLKLFTAAVVAATTALGGLALVTGAAQAAALITAGKVAAGTAGAAIALKGKQTLEALSKIKNVIRNPVPAISKTGSLLSKIIDNKYAKSAGKAVSFPAAAAAGVVWSANEFYNLYQRGPATEEEMTRLRESGQFEDINYDYNLNNQADLDYYDQIAKERRDKSKPKTPFDYGATGVTTDNTGALSINTQDPKVMANLSARPGSMVSAIASPSSWVPTTIDNNIEDQTGTRTGNNSKLDSIIKELNDGQMEQMRLLIEEEKISRQSIIETLVDGFRRLTAAIDSQ